MTNLARRLLRLDGRKLASIAFFGAMVLALPAVIFAQEIGDAVSGALTPADVLTLEGASIIVSIAMGAILSAIGWTKPENAGTKDRFGPLLALLVGVVIVGGFALSQGADVVSAVLTGFLAGQGSMGVHDVVKVATSG